MEGRDLKILLRDAVKELRRNADATEKMVELAQAEPTFMIETGPPVCPHCGRLNPEVTDVGAGGSGPLGDFVMVGETHCCNKTLYAVPIGFETFPQVELAQDALNRRGGMTNE